MGARLRTAVVAACFVSLMLAAPSAHATFPGANGKIVMTQGGITTINPDGTAETTIKPPATTADSTSYSNPQWSPDGSRIVLDRCILTNGNCNNHDLVTVSLDGSNETVVGLHPGSGVQPAWSPDGIQLAQVGVSRDGIWASNLDGTNQRQIVQPAAPQTFPDWSPNGNLVAYLEQHSPSPPAIVVGNVNTLATEVSVEGFGPPSWSPDGSKIAFSRPVGLYHNVFTLDVATHVVTRVTTDAIANDLTPVWSPDGRKIAFVSQRDDAANCPGCKTAIFVMNADGSDQHRISRLVQGGNLFPDWQPIPGPQRSDYKNAAQFCKAEREFLGDNAFRQQYGGGANAYGKCVSGK